MENQSSSLGKFKDYFAFIVIALTIALSWLLFLYVLGNGSNFVGGDSKNEPLEGNYFGIVFKGGFIVPFLMSFLMMVITFSVERLFTIYLASGKASPEVFVKRVKSLVSQNDVEGALKACDQQEGSVGNVVKAMLIKYKQMASEPGLLKDQKVIALQKELEDATSLELPMLEKNLTIVATLASIATLTGLLGTVIGMIKAFAALANAGAPDATALANGISEALLNTALGIATSALAIIAYNYFTSRIDSLTYSIDEVGFSITQSFSANQK
jgi:biopolymer transport protein ExbB